MGVERGEKSTRQVAAEEPPAEYPNVHPGQRDY